MSIPQIGQAPRTVLVMRAVSSEAADSELGADAEVLKSPNGSIRFVMEILENIGQRNQCFYELKLATNT